MVEPAGQRKWQAVARWRLTVVFSVLQLGQGACSTAGEEEGVGSSVP